MTDTQFNTAAHAASVAVALIAKIIEAAIEKHTPAEEVLRAISSVQFTQAFEPEDTHSVGLSVLNRIRSTGHYDY